MKQRSKNIWLSIYLGIPLMIVLLCTCLAPRVDGQTVKIEAENYSAMSGIQNEDCSEGGLNVAYINNGDWFDHKITAPVTGPYLFSFRVAGQGSFQLKKGTATLFTVIIPATGGYQSWTTINANVQLTAEVQTLRFLSTSGTYWNINWFSFTPPVIVTPPVTTGTYSKGFIDSNFIRKSTSDTLTLKISGKDTTISFPFPGLKVKVIATKDQ